MDFVMGLPQSEGNTVILTIVDRYSKAAHCVVLSKLPLALETANLLTWHVIHQHGMPLDIDSDCRPQFVSHVWKAFYKVIGTTASLSSCFHSQTKGQTERTNQDLESTLHCIAESDLSTWSLPLGEKLS